jgi:hypothetical protein
MGSSSDAEPMREGELIWEKRGFIAFKNQWERKELFPAFLPFQK